MGRFAWTQSWRALRFSDLESARELPYLPGVVGREFSRESEVTRFEKNERFGACASVVAYVVSNFFSNFWPSFRKL